MNNKRQTIWLVSMLSLMVVLSAYYLFTQDAGVKVDSVADKTKVMDGKTTSTPGTNGANEVTVNEVTTKDGGAAAGQASSDKTAAAKDATSKDTTAKDTAAKDTAAGGTSKETAKTDSSSQSAGQQTKTAKTDGQVLDELKAGQKTGQGAKATAAAVIDDYLLEREVNNQKKQEELMAAMNDKSSTEAAEAQKQLTALEDKQAKITGIEEELQQQFASAVVKEEDQNIYKVVVLSNKMDAKQAVKIVDKVMKEFNVTQDKVKVQYVSE